MMMYTRREDQGQIVTVSYGYDSEGGAYRRTHDASDHSTVWEHGELDWDREPEGIDYERAPCVHKWEPCRPPRDYELSLADFGGTQ